MNTKETIALLIRLDRLEQRVADLEARDLPDETAQAVSLAKRGPGRPRKDAASA